jgi:D-alanine-D-alanine ligase
MLAFDKIKAKEAFARAGILTPVHIAFAESDKTGGLKKKLEAMGEKFVVKPVCQGSSVGISITDSCDEAVELAQSTSREYGDCIIEQFIAGREITVGVLCGEAMPIIEIRSRSLFYDYNAKYVDEGTQFLFDTITDSSLRGDIASAAMDCFHALGCRGFGRVDFILTDDGKAYALELNTIPGFTSHSLLPRAAARTGLTMPMLCKKIVEETLRDNEARCCGGVDCCGTGIRT